MGTDQTVQISEAGISLVTATSRTSADCRNPGSPNLLVEPINPSQNLNTPLRTIAKFLIDTPDAEQSWSSG